MVARVYATADDFTTFAGDYPPVNIVALLTRASHDVDNVLRGAVYDTDDDGLPTDTTAAEALRDAVCAQVQSWLPDPNAQQMAPAEDGWPRLARAARPAVTPGGPTVCDEAAEPLYTAGLLPVHVWTCG